MLIRKTLLALLLLICADAWGQEKLLRIISPTKGDLVLAGQSITVKVAVAAPAKLVMVLSDGPLSCTSLSATECTLEVPLDTMPDEYVITAVGTAQDGMEMSESVPIQVESKEDPFLIFTASPIELFESVGQQSFLQIYGLLRGMEHALGISHSTRLKYTSQNENVATVDQSGMVTATGPGQTVLFVQWGKPELKLITQIQVKVDQPPPTGPKPEIADFTPRTGIPGITEITITGRDFGANQGSSTLQLGTANATAIRLWSDTRIIATIPKWAEHGGIQIQRGGVYGNSLEFRVQGPIIQSFDPDLIEPGVKITIEGSGFGFAQGEGFVTMNKVRAKIVLWDDKRIVAIVPAGVREGELLVYQNGIESTPANLYAK
jgi:hypothetical protein